MACGDRYEHLVQASGGRTRDKPYSSTFGAQLWCNKPDAEAWYAQVTHVFQLQRAAWNELVEIENGLGEAHGWKFSREIRPSATAYENQYYGLDDPDWYMAFGAGGCDQAVDAYISNLDFGKCVLERLNDALTLLGSGTIDPGGKPPPGGAVGDWLPWVIAGTAVAVVGIGGYVGYRYYKKAKRVVGNPRRRRKKIAA